MARFSRATKHEARLRLALIGPAGTGKTYSALAIAQSLVPNGRVAVIDTERGSASKYADQFQFDTCSLEHHSPTDYVEAIRDAERAGYDVIVIDSLSHAWSGKGGALEMVDAAAKRARTPNTFGAWREVTPLHNEMVDAIVGCRSHVIVTMRAKTEWVQEQDERGKTRIRKVGLAPVQRDGLEYEFDVVGDLDSEHALLITKTRCSSLAGKLVAHPGAEFAAVLRGWLSGSPAPAQAPAPAPAANSAPAQQQAQQAQPAAQAAPAPAPAPAPAIEDVLKAFQQAATEAQLLEAGAMARGLPPKIQSVARTAYTKRLTEIRWRDQTLARFLALPSATKQAVVDLLGSSGVMVDLAGDLSLLSDDDVFAIETATETITTNSLTEEP